MLCFLQGDVNTGGIVAGVIVALLLLALLGFGIWYAHKKGYLPSEFLHCLKSCISHITKGSKKLRLSWLQLEDQEVVSWF